MKLNQPGAGIYVPDGTDVADALARTTHMGIGAHQDDLEIMAYHGIVQCFGVDDKWFTGITCTNGGGAPRDALYADYTDEMMQVVRRKEQDKAANLGEYSAQVALDYPSSGIKNAAETDIVEDLKSLISAAKPRVIYTHNLADKHDTHVAVTLRVIRTLRELPPECRPKKLLGCEVWRDLDWLCDEDKQALPVDAHENLANALLGVYDSQIVGGKRYDLATMGRRRAHATYHASHGTDETEGLTFAMDLTPLLEDPTVEPTDYVASFIQRFTDDVNDRVRKLS